MEAERGDRAEDTACEFIDFRRAGERGLKPAKMAGKLAQVGLQVGGRWTDGTGSTENGAVVGGVLHKISTPVVWRYDLAAPLRPWRVTGGGLDATFTPFYDKRSKTDLGVLASRTDQCFGECARSRSDQGDAAQLVEHRGGGQCTAGVFRAVGGLLDRKSVV